jgi:hypothetical protein
MFYIFANNSNINNTIASVPFVAAQTVFNGSPVPTRNFGNFFQGEPVVALNPNPGQMCSFGFVALSCSTPTVWGGDLHPQPSYLQQWNFSVQRQLSAATSLDVAYVGNKSTHLSQGLQINDPLPGPGAIQARRPFQQWGAITYPAFWENANYNGLQAKLEMRAWRGLNLLASYGYSKCIDSGSGEGGTTISMLRFYRAVCDYDVPQNLAASFNYQIPMGKGHQLFGSSSGWMQQVFSGWELAGIFTERSGQPFSPTVAGDPANTGVASRPDLVGAPVLPHTVNCWFYTSANSLCSAAAPGTRDAFVPPPSQLRYGNAGRNILRADFLNQVDFTIIKVFRLSESKRLQARGEFFNILNHPTFSAPSTDITSSSGGQVSSTLNSARVIQLALKVSF